MNTRVSAHIILAVLGRGDPRGHRSKRFDLPVRSTSAQYSSPRGNNILGNVTANESSDGKVDTKIRHDTPGTYAGASAVADLERTTTSSLVALIQCNSAQIHSHMREQACIFPKARKNGPTAVAINSLRMGTIRGCSVDEQSHMVTTGGLLLVPSSRRVSILFQHARLILSAVNGYEHCTCLNSCRRS